VQKFHDVTRNACPILTFSCMPGRSLKQGEDLLVLRWLDAGGVMGEVERVKDQDDQQDQWDQ